MVLGNWLFWLEDEIMKEKFGSSDKNGFPFNYIYQKENQMEKKLINEQ